MSDGNTENTIDPGTDNLDDFTQLFEGKAKPAEPATETVPTKKPQEQVDTNDVDDSNETETPSEESSQEPEPEENTEDTDDFGEHEDDKPRLNGKKKSFQDRIDELTAARRDAERRAQELEEKLAQLDSLKVQQKETPVTADEPDPDAIGENGELKYPLGTYDPNYIRDLNQYSFNKALEDFRRQETERLEQEAVQMAQRNLVNSWEDKLVEAEKEIPDIRRKGEQLGNALEGLNPQDSEFVAATLMTMEHGPLVVAYLSDNITEARKIVSSGPVQATLALGRLEAILSPTKEKSQAVKPTSAPEPPPQLNKGRDGRFKVAGDTDDLEAFEKVFFK